MSVLDRVRARYEAITEAPVAVVPEWGTNGDPLVVYAKPWTVQDDEKFERAYGRDADWSLHVVIAKALDAEGQPLFSKADLMDLKRQAERHVVTRIASAIMFSLSVDDAKKNSETTDEP